MDTEAKRRASLAVSVVALVLPVADASIALADRGLVSYVYGANVGVSVPLDLEGAFRTVAGHRFGVEEGHEYRVVEGHSLRVAELK